MSSEEARRADVVEIGRRLHRRGYVAANDGNVSARLDAERLLTISIEPLCQSSAVHYRWTMVVLYSQVLEALD